MSKKIRKTRGMTLVEVTVSLAILAILITIASGVIITTFNIFAKNTLMRVAQDNGNNVYNTIYDHISCATALKIADSVELNNERKFSTEQLDFLKNDDIEVDETVSSLCTVKPYWEVMSIGTEEMTVQRKTVHQPVYIYGDGKNTMNGCSCIVTFKKYEAESDILEFSVEIKRDNETYYIRSGSIPLLNEAVKKYIKVERNISSEDNLKIFYTYLQ